MGRRADGEGREGKEEEVDALRTNIGMRSEEETMEVDRASGEIVDLHEDAPSKKVEGPSVIICER